MFAFAVLDKTQRFYSYPRTLQSASLAPGGPNWLRDLHGVREPKGSRRLLSVTSSGAVLVFGMLCFGKG